MKITKSQLKQIIKEELEAAMAEEQTPIEENEVVEEGLLSWLQDFVFSDAIQSYAKMIKDHGDLGTIEQMPGYGKMIQQLKTHGISPVLFIQQILEPPSSVRFSVGAGVEEP